jgi:hypothetical protein
MATGSSGSVREQFKVLNNISFINSLLFHLVISVFMNLTYILVNCTSKIAVGNPLVNFDSTIL